MPARIVSGHLNNNNLRWSENYAGYLNQEPVHCFMITVVSSLKPRALYSIFYNEQVFFLHQKNDAFDERRMTIVNGCLSESIMNILPSGVTDI